jgi:NAD-dependent dihydropyrimidine dehydrogenase PreA subunit
MIIAASICRLPAGDKMKRIILFIITVFSCLIINGQSPAAKNLECPTSRADWKDIAEYKVKYQPVEYLPEAALWQVADISILVILLVIAATAGRTGRNRMFWLFAAIGLGYYGIIRGGCICPVGAVANVVIGMITPENVGRVTVIFFLIPLAAAFFAGRVFCVTACPLGACQHLTAKKQPLMLPRKLNLILLLTAPLMLLAVCYQAVTASCLLICLLDPFKPLFFLGHAWFKQFTAWLSGTSCEHGMLLVCGVASWGILAGVLILSRWITRPFCRWVCPYGVLLGIFSAVGFRRRVINQEKCTRCLQCRNVCPVQAITISPEKSTISSYSCIQCNRCGNVCQQNAISSNKAAVDKVE